MENFRIIKHQNLSSADGLAMDEALIKSLEKGYCVPTLHLYTYKPSVIVGQFQNLQSSIRIDKCESLGIEMNRRCSGGGTVFMSPDQLALGFALPNSFPNLPKTIKGLFEFLAAPLSDALKKFGILSEFEGKNDLQVDGRKIAGLAISQDSPNVTFFHVSLLLDFDIPLMLEILNLPTEKFLDRGISCFGERMTTIRNEVKKNNVSASKNTILSSENVCNSPDNLNMEIIMNEVHYAFNRFFASEFVEGDWSCKEREIIEELKKEKYLNEEWIFKSRTPKKRHIYVSSRTDGGLLQAHVAFSGNCIETILLTGDYFSRTREVCKLESVLKWNIADEQSLNKTLESINNGDIFYRINKDQIISLILEAAKLNKTEKLIS